MVMFCLPLSLWVRMKRDVTPATEYLYPKSFQMYFLLSSPQLNKYIFFFHGGGGDGCCCYPTVIIIINRKGFRFNLYLLMSNTDPRGICALKVKRRNFFFLNLIPYTLGVSVL